MWQLSELRSTCQQTCRNCLMMFGTESTIIIRYEKAFFLHLTATLKVPPYWITLPKESKEPFPSIALSIKHHLHVCLSVSSSLQPRLQLQVIFMMLPYLTKKRWVGRNRSFFRRAPLFVLAGAEWWDGRVTDRDLQSGMRHFIGTIDVNGIIVYVYVICLLV